MLAMPQRSRCTCTGSFNPATVSSPSSRASTCFARARRASGDSLSGGRCPRAGPVAEGTGPSPTRRRNAHRRFPLMTVSLAVGRLELVQGNLTGQGPSLLGQQPLAGVLEPFPLLFRDLRVPQVEPAQSRAQDVGDDGSGHPFVVRGDDIPWRLVGTGRGKGVLVGLPILIPEAPLGQVRSGELPV